MIIMAWILMICCLLAVLTIFVLNPLRTWIEYLCKGALGVSRGEDLPSVSLLLAARNAEAFIGEKIRNCLALDYPPDRLEILVYSDGSTDKTEEIIRSFSDPRVRLLAAELHQGKIHGLNVSVPECRGDLILFTDVDALLEPGALKALVPCFADASVGGVCGGLAIGEEKKLAGAQRDFLNFDAFLKQMESRTGSISSNYGKLFILRRELFRPIPEAVTDDLYSLLAVVDQGFRFLFEPAARARMRVPARNSAHEIERRRRIVSTSLRGIWMMKQLLDPRRHGSFAINLLVNKVLRRLLPVFLLLLLPASLILSPRYPVVALLALSQMLFYTLAALSPWISGWGKSPRLLTRIAALAFYFTLGNLGSLMGLGDFLLGQRIEKWNPVKTDPAGS